MDLNVLSRNNCTHVRAVARLRDVIAAWKNRDEISIEELSNEAEDSKDGVEKNVLGEERIVDANYKSEDEESQYRDSQSNRLVGENFDKAANEFPSMEKNQTDSTNEDEIINLAKHQPDFQIEQLKDQILPRPSPSGQVQYLRKYISCLKRQRLQKSNYMRKKIIVRKYFVEEMVSSNNDSTIRTTQILESSKVICYKSKRASKRGMIKTNEMRPKMLQSGVKVNRFEIDIVDHMQCSLSSIHETPTAIDSSKELPDAGESYVDLSSAEPKDAESGIQRKSSAVQDSLANEDDVKKTTNQNNNEWTEEFPDAVKSSAVSNNVESEEQRECCAEENDSWHESRKILPMIEGSIDRNGNVLQMIATSTEACEEMNPELKVTSSDSGGVNWGRSEESKPEKHVVEKEIEFSLLLNSAIQVGEVSSNGDGNKQTASSHKIPEDSIKLCKNVSTLRDDPYIFRIDEDKLSKTISETRKDKVVVVKEKAKSPKQDEKLPKSFIKSRDAKRIGKIIPKKKKKKIISRKKGKNGVTLVKVLADKKTEKTAKKCKKSTDKPRLHLLGKISLNKYRKPGEMPKLNITTVNLSKLSSIDRRSIPIKTKVSKLVKTSRYPVPESIEIINSTKAEIEEAFGRARKIIPLVKDKKIPIEMKTTEKFYRPNELFENSKNREMENNTMKLELVPKQTEGRNHSHERKIRTKAEIEETYGKASKSIPIEVKTTEKLSEQSNDREVKSNKMELKLLPNTEARNYPCKTKVQAKADKVEDTNDTNSDKGLKSLKLKHVRKFKRTEECASKNKTAALIKSSNYHIPVSIDITSAERPKTRELVQTFIPAYFPQKESEVITDPGKQEEFSANGTLNKINSFGRFEELEISLKKMKKPLETKNDYKKEDEYCNKENSRKEELPTESKETPVSASAEDDWENWSYNEVRKTTDDAESRPMIDKDSRKDTEKQGIPDTKALTRLEGTEVDANCANTSNRVMLNEEKEFVAHEVPTLIPIDKGGGYVSYFSQDSVIPASPSIFSDDGDYDAGSQLEIELEERFEETSSESSERKDEKVENEEIEKLFFDRELDHILSNVDSWSDDSFSPL